MNNEWIKDQLNLPHIDAKDMPNIALYMDQLTTFMEEELEPSKRFADDKIMTKTMINNYTKNKILPPSDKKKYSKDHLFMLIFIYYMKNILSITDIQTLLSPLKEEYFGKQNSAQLSLEEIYTKITDQFHTEEDRLLEDVLSSYNKSINLFQDNTVSKEEKEFMQEFSLICQLAYDICARKQLMERMIDKMAKKQENPKKKK